VEDRPVKRTRNLTVLLALLAPACFAQSYPVKPVHLVTQFAAGSTGDVLSRLTASSMSELSGQPVVVDNRPGAGGVLAAELVQRSAPDGYNLLVATTGTHVMRVHLVKKQSFDPLKDFTPITEMGETVALFVAHPSFPVSSFRDMLEYAKKFPGKVLYGTSGIGSPHHLSAELIQQLTGVKLTHVPYKASSAALQDTVSGNLMSTFAISGIVVPAVRAGKVKALAINRENRFPALPDVPTISEVVPGFEPPPSWSGLFGPGNMPPALLKQVHGLAVKALNSPVTKQKLAEQYFDVITQPTPEEFAALLKRQIDLVGKIVKSANIQTTD
jgi:tripartite-type tricarboxylate transporter receptor subunit TctC